MNQREGISLDLVVSLCKNIFTSNLQNPPGNLIDECYIGFHVKCPGIGEGIE